MFGTLKKFKIQHSSREESSAHGKVKEVLLKYYLYHSNQQNPSYKVTKVCPIHYLLQ